MILTLLIVCHAGSFADVSQIISSSYLLQQIPRHLMRLCSCSSNPYCIVFYCCINKPSQIYWLQTTPLLSYSLIGQKSDTGCGLTRLKPYCWAVSLSGGSREQFIPSLFQDLDWRPSSVLATPPSSVFKAARTG